MTAAIVSASEQNGAQNLEFQVTEGQGRVFTVVELDGDDTTALEQDIRKAEPSAEYLAKWDIPAEIDMETYLGRKKTNAPSTPRSPRSASWALTYARIPSSACTSTTLLMRTPWCGAAWP